MVEKGSKSPCHYPDSVLTTLKETIVRVFWTKKKMRQLLERSGVSDGLIAAQNWDRYKFHVVDPILEQLNRTKAGKDPLDRLLAETLSYRDGDHLLWATDGKKLKKDAEASLAKLRALVEAHNKDLERETKEQQKQREREAQEKERDLHWQKLVQLKEEFLACYAAQDKQARGYKLQDILYELFLLFDLRPKGSFKITGEQIDGAFAMGGVDYLLEAKWEEDPSNLKDLMGLHQSVESKIDNTLGLFVSINGFTKDAKLSYTRGRRPRLITLEGDDLMVVLEGQFDLRELLTRKREIAAQRGGVFVSARNILKGKET